MAEERRRWEEAEARAEEDRRRMEQMFQYIQGLGAYSGYVPPPMIFTPPNDPAVTHVSFSTLNLNVNVDMNI